MARVLRRPRAAEDIAAVWDFIADDSLAAADRWVRGASLAFLLVTPALLTAAVICWTAGSRRNWWRGMITFWRFPGTCT